MLDRMLAGLTAALFVLRLITRTEAVAEGETLLIAQLSLLGLLLWVLVRYASGRLSIRCGWLDLGVALLAGGHILGSVVVLCTNGDQRAAMNLLWEWFGLAATFFLVRQVLWTADGVTVRRWLIVPIVTLGVATSGLGIWQHYYGLAKSGEAYRKLTKTYDDLHAHPRPGDPAWGKALRNAQREMLELKIPLDPQDRSGWESRALHSSEPFGFFALANSLAGWLAVVLVLLLGTAWLGLLDAGWRAARFPILMSLPTAYCLLLTKSRTAWVGTALGIGILVVAEVWKRRKTGNPVFGRSASYGMLAVTLTGVVLGGLVWRTGGLDRFVLLEAGKSLRYRMEWWRATWRMLCSSWSNAVLGVGPGNFRQHYLEFKLPESSEEIADPHNLFLDAWSNGGLLGLVGLLFIVGWTLHSAWRQSQRRDYAQERTVASTGEFQQSTPGLRTTGGVRFGGWIQDQNVWVIGLGCVWEMFLHGNEAQIGGVAAGAVTLSVVLSLTGRSIEHSPLVLAAAFIALVVHLLGAGGLGTPGVSQLLLLLAALIDVGGSGSIWTQPMKETEKRAAGVGGFIAAFSVSVILFAGGWWNLTMVLNSGTAVAKGYDDLLKGDADRAEGAFRFGESADRWSIEPTRGRVATAVERWQSRRDEASFDAAVALQQQVIARDPRSNSSYLTLGNLYSRRFERTGEAKDARSAAEWFQKAAARHPTSAGLRVQCAEAWVQGKNASAARAEAGRALELHEINVRAGHPDKQLSAERVRRMQAILSSGSDAGVD